MGRTLVIAPPIAAPAPPPPPRAGGGPAGDALRPPGSFLPYSPKVPKPVADGLGATLKQSRAAGYPLKVAIIATPQDLGSVPQYFGKPQPYASFLEREIAFNKPEPLLVVMPAGYGTAALGPEAGKALDGLPSPQPTGDALGRSAIDASLRLAKAAGHPVPPPKLPKSS